MISQFCTLSKNLFRKALKIDSWKKHTSLNKKNNHHINTHRWIWTLYNDLASRVLFDIVSSVPIRFICFSQGDRSICISILTAFYFVISHCDRARTRVCIFGV